MYVLVYEKERNKKWREYNDHLSKTWYRHRQDVYMYVRVYRDRNKKEQLTWREYNDHLSKTWYRQLTKWFQRRMNAARGHLPLQTLLMNVCVCVCEEWTPRGVIFLLENCSRLCVLVYVCECLEKHSQESRLKQHERPGKIIHETLFDDANVTFSNNAHASRRL